MGQVYALFDGMSEYLRLTNPWGAGDPRPEPDETRVDDEKRPDQSAVAFLAAHNALHPKVDIKKRADLSREHRELLDQFLKDENAR